MFTATDRGSGVPSVLTACTPDQVRGKLCEQIPLRLRPSRSLTPYPGTGQARTPHVKPAVWWEFTTLDRT